jgi:thiol-disulfide isomerase/thioredoxin
MKNSRILSVAVSVFLLSVSAAQAQINFYKGNWNELVAEAKKQNKPFFVDFWATWCGPCIMMNKTTFQDAKVGDFVNKNFLAAKYDAEREGKEQAQRFQVRAYPTVMFFSPAGEKIGEAVGYHGAPDFIEVLKRYVPEGAKTKDTGSKPTGSAVSPSSYMQQKQSWLATLEKKAFADLGTASQKAQEWGLKRDEFGYSDWKKDHAAALSDAQKNMLDALFLFHAKRYTESFARVNALHEQKHLTADQLHWFAAQYITFDAVEVQAMRWVNAALLKQAAVELYDTKVALLLKAGRVEDAKAESRTLSKLVAKQDDSLVEVKLARQVCQLAETGARL